ncbi:hypothetical protein K474DRAFT_1334705 [Panus rudis PR-1116 ss-1]|nr:hypothetical protein K474DRAFT_1334705 [Panus rudis PR-1116 ss-1]
MLTEDELYLVLPYLRGQSIVNAMCTCRALYSVGLRLLLGSPIRLHEKQIEPFVRFILKDPATYGPMLRDISLINTSRSECFDSAVVALINKEFCDILNYSTNIRAFKVTNVAFSSSLDSVRPLVQKLFTLKTLQKLSLSCNPSRDSSNRALQAAIEASIQNALCSLTHLEITHASGIALASSWRAAFSRFSPTLKSLSIPILLLGDITQPFPRLTTLNVWIMHFPSHRGYIPTTDIVHLFPRLRDLFIEGIVSRIPGEMVACLELDHDFFRAKNTDRSVPQHRWPQLEHVATRADTYYALAVECPVRVLNLTYGGQILRKGRTSEIRQQSLFTVARQVILSAQPHALKVACGLEVEVCNLFAGILSESPQLTHLEYNLCILPTESIRSADKLLVGNTFSLIRCAMILAAVYAPRTASFPSMTRVNVPSFAST